MEDAMIRCPVCGERDNEVVGVGEVKRRRSCRRCESRWTTIEVVEQGSVWRKGDPVPKGGRPEKRPPVRLVVDQGVGSQEPRIRPGFSGKPPITPGLPISTYISGSGSLFPALEDPDQSEGRAKKKGRARDRVARGPDGAILYPEEFLTLWTATGRKGSKPEALAAWIAKGRPDPARAAIKWTEYLAVLPRWRDPKDLSTWLRADGHLDDYYPGKFGSDRDGAVRESVDDVSKRWLAKHGVSS